MISEDVRLGKNVRIFHPELVNLYGCAIGDECKISAFVEIRKGVSIGSRCKIQAFAFIPEGVTIGSGVFIGPHVTFTNVTHPKAVNERGELRAEGSDFVPEKTTVEDGASIGAGATILPGLKIGAGALVGAGAVVTRDVRPNAVVVGNPAREIQK